MTLRRTTPLAWQALVAGIGVALLAPATFAATPLVGVETSPDTAIALGASVVDAAEVVEVVPVVSPPPNVDLGGLALPSRVAAYHDAGSGVHWFSLDTATLLGALTVFPRDVASYDTATTTYALEFDGSSAGVPDGVRIDALTRDRYDALLLSFDVTVALPGGIYAADEDLVSWDGVNFALAFDGSALGIGDGLDLDGISDLQTGNMLASFDASGRLSGVAFDDEDILEINTSVSVWKMAWDGSASDVAWAAADLEALDASPDRDGDGVADADDAFPDDPNESADTDGDGLGDNAETGTGVYVSPTDTGTQPDDADSDGDGFNDGDEVTAGSDPNDYNDPNPVPVPMVPLMGWLVLVAGFVALGRDWMRGPRAGSAG